MTWHYQARRRIYDSWVELVRVHDNGEVIPVSVVATYDEVLMAHELNRMLVLTSATSACRPLIWFGLADVKAWPVLEE